MSETGHNRELSDWDIRTIHAAIRSLRGCEEALRGDADHPPEAHIRRAEHVRAGLSALLARVTGVSQEEQARLDATILER